MINQSIQDIGLWEVWIEYDQFDPNIFGTLYVIGEIHSDPLCNTQFKKITSCDNNSSLLLSIPTHTHGKKSRIREILFSEPIESLDKYDSVCIYSGNELVIRFDEIEIMI